LAIATACAAADPAMPTYWSGYSNHQPPASVAVTMTTAAGMMRRTRRSQNPPRVNVPRSRSLRINPAMRNPEITKNTSTPT